MDIKEVNRADILVGDSLDVEILDLGRAGDDIIVIEPLRRREPKTIVLQNPEPEVPYVFIEREERPKWGRPPKFLGPRGGRYGKRR